ncbi:double-strand break repair protein AddB [Roseivivax sp.]
MIFEDAPTPRLYALPPGADFPAELVRGLTARHESLPPEAMARAELFLNSARMRRRVTEQFANHRAGFLPRLRLLTETGDPALRALLPAPVPPLRRRLELTALVSRLLDQEPDLAPRAALFDLAESLAQLMEEMQIEDVPPEAIAALDVSDLSGHWERALQFLRIVQHYFEATHPAPDAAQLQRRAVEARLETWAEAPPSHPVIVAGSTGSRGTTHEMMCAVARLPQGAVILPGFDFDLPRHVWDQLIDDMPRKDQSQPGEDHPQFRFARLLRDLGASPADVRPWGGDAPAPARNRLVSLALRPAPVTDQWRAEGPELPPLRAATEGMTLLEAANPREEAVAIAMRLRQAAEDGTRAALVTPDRVLTRQVSAALDRWNIVPDDSAGQPAQLSPPGRLLRQVAALLHEELTAESLLALLKHPLCHGGDDPGRDRSPHTAALPKLETHIRRKGMPYPDAEALATWGEKADQARWAAWLGRCFCAPRATGARPLADWVAAHRALAEEVVAGSAGAGPAALWDKEAGRSLRAVMDNLAAEAGAGADLTARDYAELFGAILAREEVRRSETVHRDIRIWGTIEARVMGADLIILAGLNEGSWPEAPKADPWLNRRMRAEAGLTLPERRIGLAAHDFQQAIGAREVWLTRAVKSDDADTVPSRWLNRLTNLMEGLPEREGDSALAEMRARGDAWRARVAALEAPAVSAPATRPSPKPPAEARPRKLRLTQVKTLVRDPYAIYAKEVLRLDPLNPLMQAPDALLRGVVIHDALERFGKAMRDAGLAPTPEAFLREIETVLAEKVPFPLARQLWHARLRRVAQPFVEAEKARQARARLAHIETGGETRIEPLDFTLITRADRIDMDDLGYAHLYDYKTGAPPSEKQQKSFDPQLLLTAALVMRGAFENLTPRGVGSAHYLQIGSETKEVAAPLEEMQPATVWAMFETLVADYLSPDKGFTARRAMFSDQAISDYDDLSRLGEWSVSDPADPEVLT